MTAHLPLPIAVRILVYDRNGAFKRIYQSGAGGLIGVRFSHDRRGCKVFALRFAAPVDVDKSDKVRIMLLTSATVFFYGVVRSTPIDGSTSTAYEYGGFGLNDYFLRMNVEAKAYAGTTLAAVVNDVVDSVIVVKSVITKDAAKINVPAVAVTAWNVNYSSVGEVLDAAKKLADSTGVEHLYGVDADGDFFFRPRSTTLIATLTVGKRGPYNVDGYEPEDAQEQRTRLFVLRNDGTYYTTINSALGNDIYEEKLTGPDVADADLGLWAQGYLFERERTVRSATVEWPIDTALTPDDVFGDGWVRVLSNVPPPSGYSIGPHNWGDLAWGDGRWGGEAYTGWNLDDTLAIYEVAYEVTNAGVNRTLSLGALPLRMEDMVADLNKRIGDLATVLGV